MKKYTIAIIGLVLAALVFGSCGGVKGGTIEVKNEFKGDVGGIAVIPPSLKVSVAKLLDVGGALNYIEIPAGGSHTWTFNEDGTYNIAVDIIGAGLGAKVTPSSVSLKGGITANVTVK